MIYECRKVHLYLVVLKSKTELYTAVCCVLTVCLRQLKCFGVLACILMCNVLMCRGVYHWPGHQGHEQQLAPRLFLLWHLPGCAGWCGIREERWPVSCLWGCLYNNELHSRSWCWSLEWDVYSRWWWWARYSTSVKHSQSFMLHALTAYWYIYEQGVAAKCSNNFHIINSVLIMITSPLPLTRPSMSQNIVHIKAKELSNNWITCPYFPLLFLSVKGGSPARL